MSGDLAHLDSGWPDLDRVIKGVLAGDNVVWEVDDVAAEYVPVVHRLAMAARRAGRRLLYYRFATHPAVLEPADPAGAADGGSPAAHLPGGRPCADEVVTLDPAAGFEPFVARVHDAIDRAGRGAIHVFDCLTDLAEGWASDSMLGNFFQLTCPYLFDLETLTYFALRRGGQGEAALQPILDTTQVFLEVYEHAGRRYLRPRKTQHRYSPTITMLHAWDGDRLEVVRCSATIAEVMEAVRGRGEPARGGAEPPGPPAGPSAEAPGARAEACGTGPAISSEFERLRRRLLASEGALDRLVRRYLTLDDLRDIERRLIGSGRIGGKTIGMLLARAILRAERPGLHARLEPHDSFYVGSDVFYTYLVENGIWWLRSGRDLDTLLAEAGLARRRILAGRFRDEVVRRLDALIDYFGQWPYIVRSSSLLEDNYGNAFAGKYDSVFLANQGPREQRRADLLAAMRRIYASTMSERALRYRADRGLLDRDEQMALLVMRVSGTLFDRRLFPPVAGVAFSFNPYCWHPDIDPEAGVARLVFGLGTRAVERTDDDYTRLVALNAPLRQPGANLDDLRRFTQQRVDLLDLEANQLVSLPFEDAAPDPAALPAMALMAVREEVRDDTGRVVRTVPVLNLDGLLSKTPLVRDLREILKVLSEVYEGPVDVEFTVNFPDGREPRIHLLQCRPLQARRGLPAAGPPDVEPESILLEARDAVIGHDRLVAVDWIVYIPAAAYARLPLAERSAVARLLGRLNRALRAAHPRREDRTLVYIGPGRWGTSDPALGLPVLFQEIHAAGALFEVVSMHERLIPDASLGTHFLNDLVEEDILYAALRPDRPPNRLDDAALLAAPNRLGEWVREDRLAHVVHVIRALDVAPGGLRLWADVRAQRVLCYRV